MPFIEPYHFRAESQSTQVLQGIFTKKMSKRKHLQGLVVCTSESFTPPAVLSGHLFIKRLGVI